MCVEHEQQHTHVHTLSWTIPQFETMFCETFEIL